MIAQAAPFLKLSSKFPLTILFCFSFFRSDNIRKDKFANCHQNVHNMYTERNSDISIRNKGKVITKINKKNEGRHGKQLIETQTVKLDCYLGQMHYNAFCPIIVYSLITVTLMGYVCHNGKRIHL